MIRKLASQTLIYGLSSIVPKVINYLLAPYLTYRIMSDEEFGAYNYLYAVIPFCLALLTMGMESGYFRFAGKSESEEQKRTVFGTIWGSVILFSVLFFLVVFLFRNQIYQLFDSTFMVCVIPITAGLIAVDAIASIPFAKLREEGKAFRFTLVRSLSVIVNVALTVFFYSALPLLRDTLLFGWMWVPGLGAGYAILANLIASTVTLLVLWPDYRGISIRIRPSLLRAVLVFSFPLFVGGFFGIANEFLDRVLQGRFLPGDMAQRLAQIGVYSATLKVTALMVIFTQMYRYAAEPLFLSKVKKDDFKAQNAEAMKFYTIAALFVFLAVTLFIPIFSRFVGPEFRGGMHLVPVLLAANVLVGVSLNLTFWYKFTEKTHIAVIVTMIGLLVTLPMNILLLPRMGYDISAWARLLSVTVMVTASYLLNQKYYPTDYHLKRIGEYAVLAAVIFAIGWYVKIDSFWWNYPAKGILLLLFLFYAIKREKITLKTLRKG